MTFRRSRTAGRAGRFRPRRPRCAEGPHSVRGGPARSIKQSGPPPSRAGPESGDSLGLQTEFGKSSVRVSRSGGQRIGETLRSNLGPFRRLAHTTAPVCTAQTAPRHRRGRGRLHGRTAQESCRRPPRRGAAPGRTTAMPLRGCASWATSTTTDRPSATVTASR